MSFRLAIVIFIPIILSLGLSTKVTTQTCQNKDFPSTVSAYAFDNRKAQSLALLEEYIYDNLSRDQHRFVNVSFCHTQVSKYLADFERDLISLDYARGEEKAFDIVENPFLMFRQIRRIYQTLQNDVAKGCEGYAKVKDNVEKLFITYEIPRVIERDLDHALRGILRLHYTYGFNATQDLRKGMIGGVDTGVRLSVEDCAELAKAALDIYEAQVMAYQWLMAADEIQAEESFDTDDDTKAKLKDVWTRLKNLTSLNAEQEIKQKFNGRIQKTLNGKEEFDDYDYYATCRGESFLTEEELSQRFCYYESTFHPYLLLNPAKVEYLSFDPVILQIYDTVNPSATSFIRKSLAETMTPGAVGNTNCPLRNRMETDIRNPLKHPELVRMFLKEETVTGLLTREGSASQLIASTYNSFGFLSYHYDILTGRFDLNETGDRIVTIIYYITDVQLGGVTAFPEVGVWATPVQNSAIIWFNLNETGHPDTRMLHGGCPVHLGTKTIATKWIFQNDNIFKKPCPLHAASDLQEQISNVTN